MSPDDFSIGLLIRVDSMLVDLPKHPHAQLSPSEIISLALLFACTGGGPGPFSHWRRNNYRKQARQRTWAGLRARLAYTLALFNILVLWDGILVDDDGMIHLSIAEFSL